MPRQNLQHLPTAEANFERCGNRHQKKWVKGTVWIFKHGTFVGPKLAYSHE